ncbi:MAG: cytochrome b N-terminal domain-containing protein [Anaerolineales bacterium]
MEEDQNPANRHPFFSRIWNALGTNPIPEDDRGRMRMVVDNLILHLHPTKVPASTLRWTYTWGLGGLAALLMLILAVTGVFLELNYTPQPEQAYLDILSLRTNVWFGDFLRNLHHWSANLLIVVSIAHLLRVFYTGAYRPPRETNWIVGILMLLLVLGANFTGYLLPWDQLAFWAITVGTSIINYIPILGPSLSRILLGGSEVGAETLLNFYSLHISFIPIALFMLMSLHFWRVRKDGGLTTPKSDRSENESPFERVTTIPHLVRRELIWALFWMGILLLWALLIPAPLEGIANPEISPNPAKAPWYFLGVQELLLHFHPLIGGIFIPAMALLGLFLLPFLDITVESVGVYFRSRRGRSLSLIAAGLSIMLTPAWLLADEYLFHWNTWLTGLPSLITDGIIPLSLVLLGFFMLDEFVRGILHASLEERILFLFTFLFMALIILTLTGIFFRGPGMELYLPWQIPGH